MRGIVARKRWVYGCAKHLDSRFPAIVRIPYHASTVAVTFAKVSVAPVVNCTE